MIKYRYQGNALIAPDPSLSQDTLLSLFQSMLRIRRIEEEIADRYPQNEMKSPIHLSIGQEATSVGVCSALEKNDWVFCGHRTHGPYLAKGGSLKAMLAELHCRSTGCAGSRGGSMHLFDKAVGMRFSSAICGGALPVATGAALAAQMQNEKRVCVVFFGDGTAEEGVTWESLNFSALKKLPILYLCENNFYSIQSALDRRQPPVSLLKKAISFGLSGEEIDGNNVFALFSATKRIKENILSGGGPHFVEAFTYRWRAHVGSEDDSKMGYRDIEEVKHWQKFCPIQMCSQYLEKQKILSPSERQEMENRIKVEIDDAFTFAKYSPQPMIEDLLRHIYA